MIFIVTIMITPLKLNHPRKVRDKQGTTIIWGLMSYQYMPI